MIFIDTKKIVTQGGSNPRYKSEKKFEYKPSHMNRTRYPQFAKDLANQ